MYSFEPILAEAYRRASLEGRDMYAFVGQMNRVKAQLTTETDWYKQWDQLDDLVGEALLNATDPKDILLLRQAFVDGLDAIFTAKIQSPDGDKNTDWQRWKAAFSNASFHWRLPALQALCKSATFKQHFGEKLDAYQQFVGYFINRRWVETRTVFYELATDENLPQNERGYHHYVCGQIDQYFNYDYKQAKNLFEKAREMLSGNPQAVHGLIEYFLKGPDKDRNLDRALSLAEEALALDPDHIPSIIQKADVLAEKGQLAEAENWYRMARQKRPGYGQCYTRLIDLYGKADLFEKKENELPGLLEAVTKLDPDTSFLTYTDLGGNYQQQGENYYQKAEDLHRAAIEQYPEGIVAPLNLGYFFLDFQKQLDNAAAIFGAVQEKTPEAWEGWLAMARLREAQENWDAALAAYKKVGALIPSWERFMQTTIGRCSRQLGQYEAAEKALLRAWQLDEFDDSGALTEFYELAQVFYKNTENPQAEKAIQMLDRVAKARDIAPEVAAGITNRQGHAHYYLENYAAALPYYERAAQLEPTEAVYFTNQFDCLEKLYQKSPEEAIFEKAQAALNQAAAIAPQDSTISKKRRQLAFVRYNPQMAKLPVFYQIYVEVGQPLLGQITTDFETLQPEMLALTDALRSRMRERFAINLPGLRYRDINEGVGVFQFRLYETPVWFDQLRLAENEQPQMAAVLEQLEHFITNYCLDLFVNYWDVDGEVPLLPNAELVHFTRVVMALLAEQTPIPPLPELHQQYRRIGGNNQTVAGAVEQLRLWEKLRQNLHGVQSSFHYVALGDQEEQLLSGFFVGEGNARALALPMDFTRSFMGAIVRKTQEHNELPFALVTKQQSLRPYLRSVLATLPQIPVLKTTELPAGASDRFLTPLIIDANDAAIFMQTYQELQSNVSSEKPPQT